MRILALVTGLFITSAFAHAAPIDGTWEAGPTAPSCTFLMKGTKLTGSCTGIGRKAAFIQDGEITEDRVTGNLLAFTLVVDADGKPVTIRFVGQLRGTLTLRTTLNGVPTVYELRRAAKLIPVPGQSFR